MFNNSTKNIKSLSKIIFIIGIISGLGIMVYGIMSSVDNEQANVGLIITGGILLVCSVVVSLFMQAFGELCENVAKIVQGSNTNTVNNNPREQTQETQQANQFNSQEEFDDFCDALKNI